MAAGQASGRGFAGLMTLVAEAATTFVTKNRTTVFKDLRLLNAIHQALNCSMTPLATCNNG
jgi:hypothetical protein